MEERDRATEDVYALFRQQSAQACIPHGKPPPLLDAMLILRIEHLSKSVSIKQRGAALAQAPGQ